MFVHKTKDVDSCVQDNNLLSKFIVKLKLFWLDSMEFYGILTDHFSFVIVVLLFIRENLILALSSEGIWTLCSTKICTQT